MTQQLRLWLKGEGARSPNGTNDFFGRKQPPQLSIFREFAKTRRVKAIATNMFSITYERRQDCTYRRREVGLIKDDMLRIQRSAQDGSIVFNLSGRIETDNIGELQNVLGLEPEKKRLVLDLKEITLVDRDAVRFLGSCEVEKMKLKNCPGYIREWITRERQIG